MEWLTLQQEKKRQERQAARAAKKQQEEELKALFGAALAVGGKKKATKYANQQESEEKPAAVDVPEEKKLTAQEALALQQKEKEDARAHSGPVFEQVAYVVAEEVWTIENIIEEKRAELAAKGIVGTPVTEESFARWKEARRLRRLEENAKKVQEEQKKKKGGKGLSVLSGKALFEYDPTLFVDDDEAMDKGDEAQFPRNMDAEIDDGGPAGGAEQKDGNGVQVQEGLFADDDDDLDDLPDDDDDDEDEAKENGENTSRVNRTDS